VLFCYVSPLALYDCSAVIMQSAVQCIVFTVARCYFLHLSVCFFSYIILSDSCRACLDQLLITIRSSLIVCDHVRSKTRMIVIIPKLGIIYTTWLHNGVLRILSLPPQSTYMYRPINTAWGEREDGEWVSQLQQPAATN